MKKDLIVNVLILTALLSLSLTCLWQIKRTKELNTVVLTLEEKNKNNKKRLNDYILQESIRIKSESVIISEKTELLNRSMTKVKLSDLKFDKPILVYRLIDKSCSVCLDDEFSLMKKIAVKIGTENLYVFSTFKNEREYYIQSRAIDRNIRFYNINEKLNIDIEDSKKSYLFVLDNNYMTRMVFSPEFKNEEAFLSLVDIAVKKYLINSY